MKVIDCKQGSTEWSLARLGVVTASEVDSLVTPLWKTRTGEGVETYRYLKLAEKLVGYMPPDVGTFAMAQGNVVETIARPWYAFEYNVNVETPGFCVSDDGRIGCSPDGLVGEDCGLEIKSPQPPQHLKYLVGEVVPPQYLAQVHFSMLVTNRPKWVFVSYSRHFPPLVVNVERDPKIDAALQSALAEFFEKFDAIYAKLKGASDAENAAKTAAYYAKEGITPP
jgi:hypothetical protein